VKRLLSQFTRKSQRSSDVVLGYAVFTLYILEHHAPEGYLQAFAAIDKGKAIGVPTSL